jgi:hypothetical protein
MSITPRDPEHYLSPITTTTIPKRLMYLACATQTTTEQGSLVTRWAGGALGRTHYTSDDGIRKDVMSWFDNAIDLWHYADTFCKDKRVVLWAYDLAEQLRVSQGLVHLPELGWHLDKIVLEKTSAWAQFRDGQRSLMMVDLKSWAPVPFGRLASDVGFTDVRDRSFTAGEMYNSNVAKWRCGVVRDAVAQLLRWLDSEQLGQFRPTGSGQSYAAFRRKFMSHRLLVHDDTQRLQAERAAMWTGRCEAWKHGKHDVGPFVEYDMNAAYCTIGRDCEVPTEATYSGFLRGPYDIDKLMDNYSVLAQVTVTTDIPVIPTRMGGRTVWPVGTFSSWIWDPELRLALKYCSKVHIHGVYTYIRKPALYKFCKWVLDGLNTSDPISGPVHKHVLKHWSRCLVGRLGLRYRAWERFGTQPDQDLRLITFLDMDEGVSTDMLVAGYDRFVLADLTESADSMPQIPSWVMSECRRRLWEAMIGVGLCNVMYVDTDSIIVRTRDAASLVGADAVFESPLWGQKGEYSRVTIHGPRNLVCESTRRISGVPLTARQTAPLEFTGEVMRSIKESMKAGELDCVAHIPRKFVLNAPDLRRQHLPNGTTVPFEVQPTDTTED